MITLFFLSLVGMFALFGLKSFDLKVGRIHFWHNISEKGDAEIHNLIEKVIYNYNRSKKISRIFVFEFLPAYIYEQLGKLKDKIAKKYYAAGEGFRGRRILRSNGSVSFFLEKLSEGKEK